MAWFGILLLFFPLLFTFNFSTSSVEVIIMSSLNVGTGRSSDENLNNYLGFTRIGIALFPNPISALNFFVFLKISFPVVNKLKIAWIPFLIGSPDNTTNVGDSNTLVNFSIGFTAWSWRDEMDFAFSLYSYLGD